LVTICLHGEREVKFRIFPGPALAAEILRTSDVPLSPLRLVPRSSVDGLIGERVLWRTGKLVVWYAGHLVDRSSDKPINWWTGEPVLWSTGKLVNRSTGKPIYR